MAGKIEKAQEVPLGWALRHTLRKHSDQINRIAWSPDGHLLATTSDDWTIRLWDMIAGKTRTWKGHTGRVFSVSWSPDGRTLASGALHDTIRLWDPDTGKTRRSLEGYPVSVYCVVWSPDGRTLASGASDGTVRLWDPDTGTIRRTLEGHSAAVGSVVWSQDGRTLASGADDGAVRLWDPDAGTIRRTLGGHSVAVNTVVWSPDGRTLASGADDGTVRLWNPDTGTIRRTLEGHYGNVYGVAWSPDGRLLVSKAKDRTVRLWRTNTWDQVSVLRESLESGTFGMPAFHPSSAVLATFGEDNHVVRIWDLDIDSILDAIPVTKSQVYNSAKVVLVGESEIGKTSLATRLVDRRKPDESIETTHGMAIHKVQAEDFHPKAFGIGESRDIVFWDFGGQDEYRLVHQMFLHDTALALVLIDPTRGRAAFDQARDWNHRLAKQLGDRKAVKLLIGAKLDTDSDLIDTAAIEGLIAECGFDCYLPTSAKMNRGIDALRDEIVKRIDWSTLGQTSRPDLFQRIRDEVEARQMAGEVVVSLPDLKAFIRDRYPDIFEERAVAAVSDQLASQGLLAKTQLPDKTEALVLRVDVVERYAGSLIVTANKRPRGVPALVEDQIGAAGQRLPGMTTKDRLTLEAERVVLQCVVELMVRQGICFRHQGLLVFPTLFPEPPSDADRADKLPHSVSLWYDFTGAIDNIYASLVAGLMASDRFGPGRLSPGRVVFDHPKSGRCGLRQIRRPGGLAHLDLFFGDDTRKPHKQLFIRFVEDHLRTASVEIREHEAFACVCGKIVDEVTVQERISDGRSDVLCPRCGKITPISEGGGGSRPRDPAAEKQLLALRKRVEKKLTADAKAAALAVSQATNPDPAQPVRILHLSDLHFAPDTKWKPRFQALMNDLTGEKLEPGDVHFVVVSGDFTDCGAEAGFDPAREFVQAVREELNIPITRVVLIPGNHDVVNREEHYAQRYKPDGLKEGEFVQAGKVCLARDREKWAERFKPFSEKLYQPLHVVPYPADPDSQGQAFDHPGYRLQFLAFNTAWEIDFHFPKRSGLKVEAVLTAIDAAGKLAKGTKVPPLRIAVCHHAVMHAEGMKDQDVIDHLTKAGVRLVLHGDVHETNVVTNPYRWKGMVVLGAGTFGAEAKDRPESTPRMYQVIELMPGEGPGGFEWAKIRTRSCPKTTGPWADGDIWPNPDGRGKVSHLDVDLNTGRALTETTAPARNGKRAAGSAKRTVR
ncbi:MAG: hypothetical protein JWO38_1399 [Gemmataceae bacterium]|nr:hypothetical protein [Gemmataceae bacterium]